MEHTHLASQAAEVGLQNGVALLMSLGAMVIMVFGGVWALTLGVRTLLGLARTDVMPALSGFWWSRQLDARATVTTAAGLVHGQTVRCRGTVEADALARATFSGVGAVVCGHAFGELGGAVLGEGLVARDFVLRLQDGTPVRVWVADAARAGRLGLLDASPRSWRARRSLRGWFRESRVVPGDEIDLVGVVGLQVDPDAPRLGDRQPPVCWTMAPARERLIIRFATRASGAVDGVVADVPAGARAVG